jgi:GNAT superfamily N-acetyltransferase
MADFPLRRAQPEDVAAIRKVVNEAFEDYIPLIGRTPLPMLNDHADLIARHDVWVLEQDHNIVAVLEMIVRENDLYIDTVAVKKSHQSKGIGKKSLSFAETQAREHGLHAMTLMTNERYSALLDMYARRGYVETHRVPVQGTDAVHLRKNLEVSA